MSIIVSVNINFSLVKCHFRKLKRNFMQLKRTLYVLLRSIVLTSYNIFFCERYSFMSSFKVKDTGILCKYLFKIRFGINPFMLSISV